MGIFIFRLLDYLFIPNGNWLELNYFTSTASTHVSLMILFPPENIKKSVPNEVRVPLSSVGGPGGSVE